MNMPETIQEILYFIAVCASGVLVTVIMFFVFLCAYFNSKWKDML